MKRLAVAVLALVLSGITSAWWAYRPGGFRNPHDWMSSHIHKNEPCPPLETKIGKDYTFTVPCIAEQPFYPLVFIYTDEKNGVYIHRAFDVCLKHGELKPIDYAMKTTSVTIK